MSLLLPNVGKPKKLLEQVRDVIRRKQFSIRTETSYIDWIKRFILFHQKRHPREMSEAEVNEFLNYLAREKNVAASTQNDSLVPRLTHPHGPPVHVAASPATPFRH